MKLKKIIFVGLALYGAKKLIEKTIDKYSDRIEAFARKKGAEIGEKIAGEIFSKKSEEKASECPSYMRYMGYESTYSLHSILQEIAAEDDILVEGLYPKAIHYTNLLQGVVNEYDPREIIDIWRKHKWQK